LLLAYSKQQHIYSFFCEGHPYLSARDRVFFLNI
jgi:hypothetical protein